MEHANPLKEKEGYPAPSLQDHRLRSRLCAPPQRDASPTSARSKNKSLSVRHRRVISMAKNQQVACWLVPGFLERTDNIVFETRPRQLLLKPSAGDP
jgi:hypothetical protein